MLAAEVRAYREEITKIAASPDPQKQKALQRFADGEQAEALDDLDLLADAKRVARDKAVAIADAAGALKSVFDGGVRKGTEALKHVRTEVLDESAWKRFDSAGRLFWNMNTPADFEEAQRLLRVARVLAAEDLDLRQRGLLHRAVAQRLPISRWSAAAAG